jgi:hypothetical protein
MLQSVSCISICHSYPRKKHVSCLLTKCKIYAFHLRQITLGAKIIDAPVIKLNKGLKLI